MNISRFVLGALLVCALPALAQPEPRPVAVDDLPYPRVSPEEAAKMVLRDTPITLHLHDVTLGTALDELEKQSGVTLDTWSGAEVVDKKLSLDLETHSFKEALQAILDEAHVKATLEQFGERGVWQVMFIETGTHQAIDAPQSGVGPFQIRLWSISSDLSKTVTPYRTGAPKRLQNSNLILNFGFVSEPQLLVAGAPRLRITRAEDENGRSLRNENPNRFSGGGGTFQGQVSVPLRAGVDGSQKLAHLEGVAVYVLPTKSEHWEVDDVMNAQNVSHDFLIAGQKMTFTIQNAHKVDGVVSLDLKSTSPDTNIRAIGVNVASPFDQLGSSIQMVDAKGQKLVSGGGSSSRRNNETTMQARFMLATSHKPPMMMQNGKLVPVPPTAPPVLTEPIKLVFDIPTEFVQTEVPFSFSDLPLP